MTYSTIRIISFLIHNLKKATWWEFMHTFVEKAKLCPTVVITLAFWFDALKEKFAEAERIYHITLKSPITELLQKTDAQRDSIITAIKAIVRAFLKSENPEEAEAARLLDVGLSSIKHNTNDRYQEQTGQVDNLLYFLMVQEAASVEKLGLTTQVQQLKAVNDRIHEFIENRVEEILDKEKGAFAKARSETEEAYRQFVLTVNSWARVNQDKLQEGASEDGATLSLEEFIRWSNGYIEYTDRNNLKEPADKVEEEVEDAEGGEQKPEENPEGGETKPEENPEQTPDQTPEQNPEQTPDQKPEDNESTGSEGGNQGSDNSGDQTGGGNNGNYPPGYDPDADEDPGV